MDHILSTYSLSRKDTTHKIIYHQLPKSLIRLSRLAVVEDFVVLYMALNKLIIAGDWNFSYFFFFLSSFPYFFLSPFLLSFIHSIFLFLLFFSNRKKTAKVEFLNPIIAIEKITSGF